MELPEKTKDLVERLFEADITDYQRRTKEAVYDGDRVARIRTGDGVYYSTQEYKEVERTV